MIYASLLDSFDSVADHLVTLKIYHILNFMAKVFK